MARIDFIFPLGKFHKLVEYITGIGILFTLFFLVATGAQQFFDFGFVWFLIYHDYWNWYKRSKIY